MRPHPTKKYATRRLRCGVTLIELLVVILIMLMISVVTIPIVAPALSNRQTREAARMVDVFLNGAKNRAVSTGRPVGVVFELDVPAGNVALDAGTVGGKAAYTVPGGSATMGYAEVPPAYTGDYSRSTINITARGATIVNTVLSSSVFNQGDTGWVGLVRPGDLIRFNSHDTLYRIFLGEPYFDVDANGVFTPGIDAFTDTNNNTFYDGPPAGMLADGYLAQATTSTPLYVDSTTGISYGMWTYTFADPALAMQYMSWYVGGAYQQPVFPAFGQQGAASFEIVRQPVPQAAGKIELPGSAAVDFGTTVGTSTVDAVPIPASGYDTNPPPATLPTPAPSIGASFRPYPLLTASGVTTTVPPTYTSRVVVTFAPTGLIDLVYTWDEPTFTWNPATIGWQGRQPIGPIYFLVGKRDLVGGDATLLQQVMNGNAPQQPCFNLQDPTNYWIVINPQTGAVMTARNAAVDLTAAPPQGTSQSSALAFWWTQTYQARGLARQALAVGGQQ